MYASFFMKKFQRDFAQYRAERDERMRRLDRLVEEERQRARPRARLRQPIMIRRDPLEYFDESTFFELFR